MQDSVNTGGGDFTGRDSINQFNFYLANSQPGHQSQLSEEGEQLLSAANNNDGDLYLIRTEQKGHWVRVGGQNFVSPNDPAYAASYLEALQNLVTRGYVTHVERQLYKLTGSGFKHARGLHLK